MTSRAALARHPVAIIGALLATVSAVVFIALLIAALVGLLRFAKNVSSASMIGSLMIRIVTVWLIAPGGIVTTMFVGT